MNAEWPHVGQYILTLRDCLLHFSPDTHLFITNFVNVDGRDVSDLLISTSVVKNAPIMSAARIGRGRRSDRWSLCRGFSNSATVNRTKDPTALRTPPAYADHGWIDEHINATPSILGNSCLRRYTLL